MSVVVLIVMKYALCPLAAMGFLMSALSLRIAFADIRTISNEKVNGPKRISSLTRIYQNAFLLAVFSVLVIVGAVFILTPAMPPEFYQTPQVMITRIGLDVIVLLLMFKELAVRRNRRLLNAYYDTEIAPTLRQHRRATDPPPPAGCD